MELAIVIIKPDGVKRNLIGEIIRRFEKRELKVVTIKMMKASKKLISKHYPGSMAVGLGKKAERGGTKVDDYEKMGKNILEWLRTYLTEGPVVPMILEGKNVGEKVREIVGYTDPPVAKKGTIRGDLGIDSIKKANEEKRAARNLIHVCDPENFEKELTIPRNDTQPITLEIPIEYVELILDQLRISLDDFNEC